MNSENVLVKGESLKVYFFVRRGFFRSTAVKAVDGISFQLRRGETIALVGESGSGKTTLGRATLGLIKPVEGTVCFEGEDISTFMDHRIKEFRRKAQPIFQDPYSSINPYMTVFQLVEEPLIIHKRGDRKEREKLVIQTLEQVKLIPAAEFATKYPHTLSGGQRQRVCIGRAIVLEPEYIVADEPVSMIDASSRAEILYLLRELQERRNLSFLYITHDLASARHFSDRIAVMYLGTQVETGPSREVIEHPLHPYTRRLLQAVPEPDPRNRFHLRPVIPGDPPSAMDVPQGCPFQPRCPESLVDECTMIRPPLNEISKGHHVACYLQGKLPES